MSNSIYRSILNQAQLGEISALILEGKTSYLLLKGKTFCFFCGTVSMFNQNYQIEHNLIITNLA